MSDGYTRGPLKAQPEAGTPRDGLHMVVDLSAEYSERGATVCTASYCTRADAYLYAAAPELLEACKGLIGLAMSGERFSERIAAAKAAIAKAEAVPTPSQDPA